MVDTQANRNLGIRVQQSYGAWIEIVSFLRPHHIILFQALSRFMYRLGVSRCQEKV